ncbi:hypothetical protein AA313_de0205938 [Arthrobotrys entomopaga]|nr:hypothetical protein AA313_de0205938 [Arthrobotrys entomopaga]
MITISLFALSYFTPGIFGIAIPGPNPRSKPVEILDRMHYDIRIRDVLNHVYDNKYGPQKRSDNATEIYCHNGGTIKHAPNTGEMSSCQYNVPIQEYNNAVRSVHLKRTGREVDHHGPAVYIGNTIKKTRARHLEEKRDPGNDPLTGDPPKDRQSNLPGSWYWVGEPECYGSGTWSKRAEFATIQRTFCETLNQSPQKGYYSSFVVFFNAIDFKNSILRTTPESDHLLDESGIRIEIDAELTSTESVYPLQGAYDACIAATDKLIWHSCGGKHDDTRGGVLYVRNFPFSEPHDHYWGFGLDPNYGRQND